MCIYDRCDTYINTLFTSQASRDRIHAAGTSVMLLAHVIGHVIASVERWTQVEVLSHRMYYWFLLEIQLPHKNVNSFFTTSNKNVKSTVWWGG